MPLAGVYPLLHPLHVRSVPLEVMGWLCCSGPSMAPEVKMDPGWPIPLMLYPPVLKSHLLLSTLG
jgi:hypothetical protein